MEKCPRCHTPMVEGFLGAQNGQAGLQWFHAFADSNLFGLLGEPVGEKEGGKGGEEMSWLRASRCSGCRLIVAHY